jgi:glyoxylase-like metal-dependent hydrolase (beta-lactamase superfamily II)
MSLPLPTEQACGVYHFRLGTWVVSAINDGIFEVTLDVMAHDRAEAERLQRAHFRREPPRITINAFLVNDGRTLTLIDSGCGTIGGPQAGAFGRHLARLGVDPAMVGRILVTHMHIDHISGLVDGEGRAIFPNAEVICHEEEARFWLGEPPAGAPEALREAFGVAKRGILPYRERLKTVKGGEVAPGITLEHLPGHTPGHSGYLLRSGNEALLMWGDIVHMPGVQFAEPRAGMVFDIDPELARATRARMFDRAAAEGLRVCGAHLDFPAFGHVVRDGGGYRFIPEVWYPDV